jgi:galactoside O-acetyltransferase
MSGRLRLGSYVHIAAYVALYGADAGIEVHDYCGISARCTRYAATDDYLGEGLTGPTIPAQFKCVEEKAVVLQRHVVLGAGCVVLPGAIVGEGSTVGALSLITGTLEAWMVYGGVPARPLKPRRRDIIERFRQRLEDGENTE